MGALLTTPKWVGIALITAMVYKASKTQSTLPSLEVAPHDIYTPDFYPNGSYLELPLGKMRYWLFGNPNGKRVVLIHGISTGSAVYDKLARYLAEEKGHYVLIYDIWGRGYTQAPPISYDEALYTSQLAMLLQKVGWTKTDVIGVSLGGAIATSFTAYYPEMVDKLVLIAPAGLMEEATDMPLISKFIRLSYVYQLIINQAWLRNWLLANVERFAKSTRLAQPDLDKETQEQSAKIAKIASYQFMYHPGFIRAFAGTVVAYPLTGLSERYKKVGQQDKVILLIWGDKDETCPYYPEKIKKLLPKAQLEIYEGQGHDVLATRWSSVHATIENFLIP
ncbi:MAG: Alpha/Beta hydrolase protein [Benjaminiella poitrasii]|nr:MAG: Alpha/Beta hydrolase protein [Benjaminiella poitrasii]